jgi:glyceraldehyde 3-phosphate dehydrogenase
MVKCAVNGFGRIGRLVFRYLWDDPTMEIVHVNDVCALESAAYLLKYDSVHGTWGHSIETGSAADNHGTPHFTVDGKVITFSQQKDYTQIDFRSMGVELIIECTGKFLTTEALRPYIDKCGIERVVVSAPVKEPTVLNVVIGCNDHKITEDHRIVTNASCTTNCLAPIVKVIKENLGIVHGCITTVHNVTGTQVKFEPIFLTSCRRITHVSFCFVMVDNCGHAQSQKR